MEVDVCMWAPGLLCWSWWAWCSAACTRWCLVARLVRGQLCFGLTPGLVLLRSVAEEPWRHCESICTVQCCAGQHATVVKSLPGAGCIARGVAACLPACLRCWVGMCSVVCCCCRGPAGAVRSSWQLLAALAAGAVLHAVAARLAATACTHLQCSSMQSSLCGLLLLQLLRLRLQQLLQLLRLHLRGPRQAGAGQPC